MGVLLLLTVIVAAIWSLHSVRSRETRLVQSVIIPSPVEAVFGVISSRERLPEWYRKPCWLPPPMRVTLPKPIGYGQPASAKPARKIDGPEEIRIRHMNNREFAYKSVRSRDLSYESTFRVVPEESGCLLIWELRYRICRLPDLLGRPLIDAAVRAGMRGSLDSICRLALISTESARPRSRILEARRDHVPAA